MTTIVNSALGLSIGDQVQVGPTAPIHTIERIWLYEPGEYEPYNIVSPGEQTGVAVEEPALSLQCRQRYQDGRTSESYLHGIVRRGDEWWIIAYSWPAFTASEGLLLRGRTELRMETAPPIIVKQQALHLVERSPAPLQLDLFGAAVRS